MPVLRLRVIEAERHSTLLAGCSELFKDVAMEGRCGHNVVAADLGIKHGKTIVVLRGNHDVLHARILGELHPCICVELHWIPLLCQLFILLHRNVSAVHNPFSQSGNLFPFPLATGNGVESPMNEEAVLGLFEPGKSRLLRLGRVGIRRADLRRNCTSATGKQRESDQEKEITFHGCPS